LENREQARLLALAEAKARDDNHSSKRAESTSSTSLPNKDDKDNNDNEKSNKPKARPRARHYGMMRLGGAAPASKKRAKTGPSNPFAARAKK
jgi:hypothetical protein